MLYTIYDSVADQFTPPIDAIKDVVAVRIARKSLEGLDDVERADFRLYRIGDFDIRTGKVTILDKYVQVDM